MRLLLAALARTGPVFWPFGRIFQARVQMTIIQCPCRTLPHVLTTAKAKGKYRYGRFNSPLPSAGRGSADACFT